MNDELFPVAPVADPRLENDIRRHLDRLTKPPGSLGRLEEFALRYGLCRGRADAPLSRMRLYTFAGDHGITEEGITPYPSEVTLQMVLNMARGGAAVSVMCRRAGIEYAVVDIGVKGACEPSPSLLVRKVAAGTRNFRRGCAMTPEECRAALAVGFELGRDSACDLLGIGEMGIGNTSSAAALYCLLLDLDAELTVGAGTGSSGALLARKKEAVRDGVRRHYQAWDRSPLDALRRVGGYEIAGMTGTIFGAASSRIPVVVDGFVASAAALTALRLEPAVGDYLFFSHASDEQFHRRFLELERIRPILTLDMRLGEGTGSVLAMQIIAQAMECYHQMATFDSAGVADKR